MALHTSSIFGQGIIVLGTLWFLVNFYCWFFPKVRRRLIEMRGPLLGFGFAFGAAMVSSVVDGVVTGWSSVVSIFIWRFLLLLVPFIAPFVRQLPRQAHAIDVIVPFYAFFILQLPVFSGVWIQMPSDIPYPGMFPHIGPANLILISLLSTYFFGIRWWSEMVMDIKIRKGDLKNTSLVVVAAVIGALVFAGLSSILGGGNSFDHALGMTGLNRPGLALILFGLLVAIPFEVLLFRVFMQSGLKRLLSSLGNSSFKKAIPMIAALAATSLHVAAGAYGLAPVVTFGFSFGVGIMIIKRNRFLPALLGHGIAWILFVVAALFTA